eukprot:797583_1
MKCFGDNMFGQIGYGDTNNRGDEANEMGDNLLEIDLGTNFIPMQIVAGYDNEVKCWGYNLHGQLGYGDTNNRGDHTCALSTANKVKCFGDNMFGQLGYGDTNNRGDAANEMGESLLEIDLGTG